MYFYARYYYSYTHASTRSSFNDCWFALWQNGQIDARWCLSIKLRLSASYHFANISPDRKVIEINRLANRLCHYRHRTLITTGQAPEEQISQCYFYKSSNQEEKGQKRWNELEIRTCISRVKGYFAYLWPENENYS